MKLLRLVLSNFKGIRSFELDTNGTNVSVFGDNATGKTTLFDAFLWLLFDKDSQNKKDFDIKTIGEDGKAYSGLNHEVEGVFEVAGKRLILKKVYAEKWTKKRGSINPEFTGHTTDYFIDGVPSSKGEYTAKVTSIADENIFKLLTSPSYFNEQLHWQDRRKILLEICGDISDDEVIASDSKLEKLLTILGDRSLEDHRKVIAARRSEINKELEKIPVRIDEALRNMPDVEGLNEKQIEQQVEELEMQKSIKQAELSNVLNGGQVSQKKKQLAEIEASLIKLENEFYTKQNAEVQAKMKLLNETNQKINNIQNDIDLRKVTIKNHKTSIELAEKTTVELRAAWHEVNGQEFVFEHDDTCPTCGQYLPKEQVEKARGKALAQFNYETSKKLEDITTIGQKTRANVGNYQGKIKELQAEIDRLTTNLAQEKQKADLLQKQIDSLQKVSQETLDTKDYREAKFKKENLHDDLKKLEAGNQEETEQIKEEIDTLSSGILSLEQLKAKLDLHKVTSKRIEELKAQEKELASEFEKLEQELYLTEEFIRSKVRLLEEKINAKFKYARFKLFDVQVNGGLNEVCETLYNGVPYSSGLNNAARINVGLDIINTLSEHYKFNAPIFVDNAEAVTELIQTKSQVIRLVVFEGDKKLRMEAV